MALATVQWHVRKQVSLFAMKTLLLPLMVLLCLSGPSPASPIQESLETTTQVKKAGIEMSCGEVAMDAGKVLDFNVTWTVDPEYVKDPEAQPSRMILTQFRDKEPDGTYPSGTRLQVTFKMDPDGKCRADFRIAEEDLEKTLLHFILASHTDYTLSLSDYVRASRSELGIPR
jgi:hypothetical protein